MPRSKAKVKTNSRQAEAVKKGSEVRAPSHVVECSVKLTRLRKSEVGADHSAAKKGLIHKKGSEVSAPGHVVDCSVKLTRLRKSEVGADPSAAKKAKMPEFIESDVKPRRGRKAKSSAITVGPPVTARTSAKSTAKQTAKPTTKQTTKTSVKPTAKQTAKTSVKPTAKQTSKTSVKPTAKQTAKSAAKQTANTSAKSTSKQAAKPTVKATAKWSVTVKATPKETANPSRALPLLHGSCDSSSSDTSESKFGFTNPLHLAIERDDMEQLRSLLQSGRHDVNARERVRGYTPVMVAVALDRLEMTHSLVQWPGVDLTLHNHLGNTAAMIALMCNKPDLLIRVLAFGGSRSVNTPNAFGYTPLMWCVAKNLVSCARHLMLAGAMVKTKSKARPGKKHGLPAGTCILYHCAVQMAREMRHFEIMRLIDEEDRKRQIQILDRIGHRISATCRDKILNPRGSKGKGKKTSAVKAPSVPKKTSPCPEADEACWFSTQLGQPL